MTVASADLSALSAFASGTTRAVLVTHRKDGGFQTSPMAVVADDNGDVLTATRAKNAKVYNLVRDSRCALCLFDERWPGPWVHVEGTVSMARLPEAMPLLQAYYARRGQDTSTEEFRQRMLREDRVLLRIKVERLYRSSV
jgi:PPOX class probable F420-dependent enzyme